MADPTGSSAPHALPRGSMPPEDDPSGVDRARRSFQALAAACRTLAASGPGRVSRISVSLAAGDDPDEPERIADMALSLADAHGFAAEIEIGRGWVTAFFSRREEES